MRCQNCHNGDLSEELRHKSAVLNGRVAVVTDIPATVCPSCGMVWYAEEIAVELDSMLTDMLDHDTMSVRPFREPATTTA
ncbi:MAG: YgiT-type zinc finger protein [Microthrixaceae bacterium]